MHAQRIVETAAPTTEASGSFRIAAGPENDNDAPTAGGRVSLPAGLVARGPSRRAYLAAAAVALSLALGAVAWSRPRPAPAAEPAGPAPVTQVEVAAHAIPVAGASEEANAPLVIAAVTPAGSHRRHRRVRTHHAHHTHHAPHAEHAEHASRAHGERHALAAASEATGEATAPDEASREPEEAEEAEGEAELPSDSADAVVEAAVGEHTEEVDACIDQAGDEAEGRVTVDLVIATSGAVRSATPHGPASLRAVGQCLAHAMSGWRMAVPDATGDTRIAWPFEVEANL